MGPHASATVDSDRKEQIERHALAIALGKLKSDRAIAAERTSTKLRMIGEIKFSPAFSKMPFIPVPAWPAEHKPLPHATALYPASQTRTPSSDLKESAAHVR